MAAGKGKQAIAAKKQKKTAAANKEKMPAAAAKGRKAAAANKEKKDAAADQGGDDRLDAPTLPTSGQVDVCKESRILINNKPLNYRCWLFLFIY